MRKTAPVVIAPFRDGVRAKLRVLLNIRARSDETEEI